jgi:hypothetical protein
MRWRTELPPLSLRSAARMLQFGKYAREQVHNEGACAHSPSIQGLPHAVALDARVLLLPN